MVDGTSGMVPNCQTKSVFYLQPVCVWERECIHTRIHTHTLPWLAQSGCLLLLLYYYPHLSTGMVWSCPWCTQAGKPHPLACTTEGALTSTVVDWLTWHLKLFSPLSPYSQHSFPTPPGLDWPHLGMCISYTFRCGEAKGKPGDSTEGRRKTEISEVEVKDGLCLLRSKPSPRHRACFTRLNYWLHRSKKKDGVFSLLEFSSFGQLLAQLGQP